MIPADFGLDGFDIEVYSYRTFGLFLSIKSQKKGNFWSTWVDNVIYDY